MRRSRPLKFKEDWEVTITEPINKGYFGESSFAVEKGDRNVIVYLDWQSKLGAEDGPYWEAYNGSEDPERFKLYDTDGLMGYIEDCLEGDIIPMVALTNEQFEDFKKGDK